MLQLVEITALDYLLIPFIVALAFLIGKYYRDKYYPFEHPDRKYFLPALFYKIIGSITICLIYIYYYKGGDTINYYYHSQVINSSLKESPQKWINLLLSIPDRFNPEYFEYTNRMEWYGNLGTYTVAQLCAILSLMCCNTFIPTALLFAIISFTGAWATYITFSRLYPKIRGAIATVTLFIPSVALWGSGIFKDTLCVFSIGWIFYSTFQIFIAGRKTFKMYALLVTMLILISLIKIYIIICFIPCLNLWLILKKTSRIKSKALALILNLFYLSATIAMFFVFFNISSDKLGKYSIENIQKTSETTRNWILYVSEKENGSSYNLGDWDLTLGGIILKFVQGVNVTLFRPYPWEAKKPIVFLSSIESLFFLVITIKVLLVVGLKNILITVGKDHTIQFCLIFSIFFAFSVGVSTFNFGALSRYKVPCLPYYLLSLVLIYYSNVKPGHSLFKTLRL